MATDTLIPLIGIGEPCLECEDGNLSWVFDQDAFRCRSCGHTYTAEFVKFYKGTWKNKEKEKTMEPTMYCPKCDEEVCNEHSDTWFCKFCAMYYSQGEVERHNNKRMQGKNGPPDNKALVEENRRLTSERDHYRDMLNRIGTRQNQGCAVLTENVERDCMEAFMNRDWYYQLLMKVGEILKLPASYDFQKIPDRVKSLMSKVEAGAGTLEEIHKREELSLDKSFFYPKSKNPGRIQTTRRRPKMDDWEV